MKKILKIVLVISLLISFPLRVYAEVNTITIDKLVETINNSDTTKSLIESGKQQDSTYNLVASKDNNNLVLTTTINGTDENTTFTYDETDNTLNYTKTDIVNPLDSFGVDMMAMLLIYWISEATTYYDELNSYTNSGKLDISNMCDMENVGVCINNDESEESASIKVELSDKTTLYTINYLKNSSESQTSDINKSTESDSANNSQTQETTTSSISDKSADETENTSTEDLKNPNTGASLNYFLIMIAVIVSIVAIIVSRKNSKFHRI